MHRSEAEYRTATLTAQRPPPEMTVVRIPCRSIHLSLFVPSVAPRKLPDVSSIGDSYTKVVRRVGFG
jgi:hypothetical protein